MSVAPRWKIALALGIVYLVWGSTYAAIAIALEGWPPMLLGGTRFILAGGLLWLFARMRGQPELSPRQRLDAAFIGFMLLCLGNGAVVWAEQTVASGLAAVLVATLPLWMVVIDAFHPKGEKPTLGVIFGLLAGLVGVGVLVRGTLELGHGPTFWLGVGLLLCAPFAWAIGSVYGRHASPPTSSLRYTAVQMLVGGVVMTIAGSLRGEWALVGPLAFSARPLVAQLYLMAFGSILAFSCFSWLMRAAPPALLGTYAYVNPMVALLLGVLFLKETLDAWTLAGSAIILASVVFTQLARRR